ncbi:hypothetical protein [Streptomyces prasinopilosus]|uniref:Lipoprotein n=1 Tax=Streptomyces prasinopilosus TaxID=67344 RepID=A0A1G6YMP4_9ACTN|nr:hypothetical protein [Streptomyces prasinopilosus]SDD90937.1 hypothetical protein SAMN05216505_11395 [Streptomyces prasinopilosus]
MATYRPVATAVAGVLLLAACTEGAGAGSASPTTSAERSGEDGGATASRSPSPSPSVSPPDEPYTVAEDRAPATRSAAVAFVRGLAVRPDFFGPGFRTRVPYESDPAEWAVLGEDCVWRREPLPDGVLASLTRAFVLPEAGGRKAVYVSLTVTVHENVLGGRRDMAVSLEEALRCQEQRLNATERVRDLYSQANPFAEERNTIADDDLMEFGVFLVDGEKEAHPFQWHKHRLGPVTVAVTSRVGAGRTAEEQDAVSSRVAKGTALVVTEVARRAAAGAGDEGGSGTKDGAGDAADGAGATTGARETDGPEVRDE